MRFEKSGILDGVTFDGSEGFCAVGNARGVAEVDEAFVWQTFVQCFVDCQSTNAAIEDSDGKIAVQVRAGLFEDLGDFHSKAGNGVVGEFVGFVKSSSVTWRRDYFNGSTSRIHEPHRSCARL